MNETLRSARMDKTAFSVGDWNDESDERASWWSRTSEERLAAMELLRVVNDGCDPTTDQLQRVLTIAQLGEC